MKHAGKVVPVPLGLVKAGPLVQVSLSPHPSIADTLRARGRPVPQLSVKMMVDTGAELTVVERRLADDLGLVPVRFIPMIGVSQKPELSPVYRMSLTLRMSDALGSAVDLRFSTDMVGMPSPPQPAEHRGLIGRDFLMHVRFVYHGPTGDFWISMPEPTTAPAQPPSTDRARKDKRKSQRDARRRNRR